VAGIFLSGTTGRKLIMELSSDGGGPCVAFHGYDSTDILERGTALGGLSLTGLKTAAQTFILGKGFDTGVTGWVPVVGGPAVDWC
jgi:hypothetical protein